MSPESHSASTPENAAPIVNGADFESMFLAWSAEIRSVIQPDEDWALIGIKRRGSILARRLWDDYRQEFPALEFGEVDISLYRDDFHLQLNKPRLLGTEIDFNVDGCRILLIDDVLYTGRTIRAALNQILDFGRPKQVLLAVLVDRGHRELPIAADFTGRRIETAVDDSVRVHVCEMDDEDNVVLVTG